MYTHLNIVASLPTTTVGALSFLGGLSFLAIVWVLVFIGFFGFLLLRKKDQPYTAFHQSMAYKKQKNEQTTENYIMQILKVLPVFLALVPDPLEAERVDPRNEPRAGAVSGCETTKSCQR